MMDVPDEGEEYDKLLASTKSKLPFLKTIIDNSGLLGIPSEHLKNLKGLYEMVDQKKLLMGLELPSDLWLVGSRLVSCENVIRSLHDKYHEQVIALNKTNTNYSSKEHIQSNEDKNETKSSELKLTSCFESDQNLISLNKSENSSKLSTSSVIKNNTSNNPQYGLNHDAKQNNFSVTEIYPKNTSKEESSSSHQDLNKNDSMPADVGVENEFVKSRIRLNKVIGFATNASIEKLNDNDLTATNSEELAKAIYNDMKTKSDECTAMCLDMLKGINMDEIDENLVKSVIENIKKSSISEPVQPPPLPPAELLELGSTRVEIDPLHKSVAVHTLPQHEPQPTSSIVTCKSMGIREKLNNEISIIHKIGSQNESKPKFISSLKPGTLIDLENSKASTSLHMESLRPVTKSNEKKSDISLNNLISSNIHVRDPRIRKKSLLNSRNNINPTQPPTTTVQNVHTLLATTEQKVQPSIPTTAQWIQPPLPNVTQKVIPKLLSLPFTKPNMNHLTDDSPQELSHNGLLGYNSPTNFRNSLGHVNTIKPVQQFNNQFPTEHNINRSRSINCRQLVQNQHRHMNSNDFTLDARKNDYNQYSSANKLYVNRTSHNDAMAKYREPLLPNTYTSYNDKIARRDPRTTKNDHQKQKTQPREPSYREFLQAKYGYEKNSDHVSARNAREKDKARTDSKNILDSFNRFGVVSDVASIKNFKIPKINRKDEVVVVAPDKKSIETKTEVIKKNCAVKDLKSDYAEDENLENKYKFTAGKTVEKDLKPEMVENSKIDKDMHVERSNQNIVKGTNSVNEDKVQIIETKQNYILSKPVQDLCKPKKQKKYSKEKEFEKIVKEAVEKSLHGECSGPRTRTRSSLKHREEDPIININMNYLNKKDGTTDDFPDKKVKENIDDKSKSCRNSLKEKEENLINNDVDNSGKKKSMVHNVIGLIETGQNVISSTSKEPSESDSTIEVLSKPSEESIVSSNVINSTADTSIPKCIDINSILAANPHFMSVLSLFQNEEKIKKLNKLLESSEVVDILEDKPKNKDLLNNKYIDVGEQKKSKKKLRKKKKKRKLIKSFTNEESTYEESNNKPFSCISDDNNLKEVILKTKKVLSCSEYSDDDCNSSSNDNSQLSINQSKTKSSKRKKSRENYGHFEILKDKNSCKAELKVVLAKFDKNRNDNSNSDVLYNNVNTTNKRKIKETAENLKSKKPFLGPLSVKLARQKLEIEQNHSHFLNESSDKIDPGFKASNELIIENNVQKGPKFVKNKKKEKINFTTNVKEEPPYIILEPFESTSSTMTSVETSFQGENVDQNPNEISSNEPDIISCKSDSKKPRPRHMTELEKLHADISEMYDCEAVLNAPSIRHCRTNKQSSVTLFQEEHKRDKSLNKISLTDSNVIDSKSYLKKSRPRYMTELDKLHADISEMYDCEAVINAPSIRQCRINKLDQGNTSDVVLSKKNKSPREKRDVNEEFNCAEKPTKIKKQIKKLTLNLNKNKTLNKKPNAKKIMPPVNEKYPVKIKKHKVILSGKSNNQKPKLSKVLRAYKKKLKKKKRESTTIDLTKELCENQSNNDPSEFITEKRLTDDDFKDRNYFQTVDNSMECKFCNYIGTGFNIVRHYKENHNEEEVLASRLSRKNAEILINESLKENFGYKTCEDLKPLNYLPTNVYFTCIFCENMFYDIAEFYDHITGHTGEYRYKCKICENVYQNVNELEKHILKHSDYNKTEISLLLHTSPTKGNRIFGYLCSFCYYIQLDYNNLTKHMKSLHIDEDKQFNGHWTIIRVSMSIGDNDYENVTIDYTNLVGCKPPIQDKEHISQFISRDTNNKNQTQLYLTINVNGESSKPSISEMIAETKQKLQVNAEAVKKEIVDDLPEILETYSQPKEGVNEDESKIKLNESVISYEHEYTLKDDSTVCSVAGLSCELVNYSVLLYKCSASKCIQNQFSTVILMDFFKHIELSHNFVTWGRKCDICKYKIETISEQSFLKNALEHIVSCHLVLKKDKSPNLYLNREQDMCHDTVNNIISDQQSSKALRVRHLPGDKLSVRDATMTAEEQEQGNFNKDNRMFVLKSCNEKSSLLLGGINCEKISDLLLFKCVNNYCLLGFSTIFLEELFKHIELHHKITPWNGMCNICGHGLWRNRNHLYMRNALEHLVSHHLTKCHKEYISPKTSVILEKKLLNDPVNEASSSTNCDSEEVVDETVNEKCREKSSLVKSTEESICMVNNPIIETSADQTNSDQVSNNEVFPMLFPQIADVLLEDNVNNTSTTNCNRGLNDDLMPPKTLYEVVSPNPQYIQFLGAGQQIVNKGKPIDGTYCLIDTDYKKCYGKKVKDLPKINMKTPTTFNEMTSLPRLLGLFKCLDKKCSKIFSSKEIFVAHLNYHISHLFKKKKTEYYDPEQFKMCAYCFRKFDDINSLANHIEDKYTFCNYFCPHCFYRAYTASHVLAHQSMFHEMRKPLILKLECDKGISENSKETLMVVDFNEFILKYKCNVGNCSFSSFVTSEFLSHLQQDHQQCDKFCCYICADQDNGEGFLALQPSLMINHFKLHNINMYQCIFCLFGTEVVDQLINHLASEHFEYEPLCLERTTLSDQNDGSKIKNLKLLRLHKLIDNGIVETVNLPPGLSSISEILPPRTKKRRLECPDVLSEALKSAHIDESTQSPILIEIPDGVQMANCVTYTPSIDNEVIMVGVNDNENQNDEENILLNTNNCWINAKNKEKVSQQSNNDVIVIDDDDIDYDDDDDGLLHIDITSNREEENMEILNKRKRSKRLSVGEYDGPNKIKRLALPVIELDKLFACKDCDQTFSNSIDYHNHLNQCPNWNLNGQQCVFCTKLFKTAFHMTEHVKLHGPNRFRCNTCGFYVPSRRAIAHHMKLQHKVTNLDFVPVNSNLNNPEKDEFIVYEDPTMELMKPKYNLNYACGECVFVCNTRKAIGLHMKTAHSINNYKICEVNSQSTNNPYTQVYNVIRNDKSIDIQKTQQQHINFERKGDNSNNDEFKKPKDNQNKSKNQSFSPENIDSIPKLHIFSDLIGCSLCTYVTKVRSNLIMHLNKHKKGEDNTSKEIVNPVPSMGKAELMFDKMINLSASSFEAMTSEKMKIIELNKKIIEVAPKDDINLLKFPQLIPKNKLYKCSILSCAYTGINEKMLKKHISVLHSSNENYICPHCAPDCIVPKVVSLHTLEFHLMLHGENLYHCQYCKYIDFNRDEMRTHMRKTHLLELTTNNQSNIIVIRQTMLEDNKIDRNKCQAGSEWICNICSNGVKYTKNEIISHVHIAHNVSSMFKCPMCRFEHSDDNAKVFEEHYKLQHPSVAVKFLRVFEKITEVEEQQKQSKHLGTAYLQEQQALESIDLALVPPTCRGIPIESSSTKNNMKSSRVSKSPKAAAKFSPFQARKQKMLTDVFSIDDSLGTISPNGQFVCPRCNIFETMNIEHFREHLYQDVHLKTWKCMKCFDISDSPKKMAWHVKKHGDGSKYEKIENIDKLKWVELVIEHQSSLNAEYKRRNKEILSEKRAQGVEQIKIVEVNVTKLNNLPLSKRVVNEEKTIDSQTTNLSNNDIINLLDSDDE